MTKRIFRIIGYAVNAFVAICTLAAAYGGMVNPSVSTIPAVFAMTFPLWLVLAAGTLIADLLSRERGMTLIPFIALLCSVGPISNHTPLNLAKGGGGKDDTEKMFTLMSYNTAALVGVNAGPVPAEKYLAPGAPRNEIVEYMIHSGADIIVSQEFPVMTPLVNLGFTREMIDTLATLYPHSLIPDYIGNRREYSCKIFSKFPLRRIELPVPSGSTEWSAAMVDIRGTETLVVDVHLQSIGLTRQDKDLYLELTDGEGRGKMREVRHSLLGKVSRASRFRAEHARLLRHVIDSIGAPNVIVAGDFNDIPGCYAIREISGEDFRNAFDDAANGPMITFHSDRFYFHIDHILYRGAMEAVDFRRGSCSESDHYPVLAKFRLE